jgi:hypothetical protein
MEEVIKYYDEDKRLDRTNFHYTWVMYRCEKVVVEKFEKW